MVVRSIVEDRRASSCYFRTTVEAPHRKALVQIDERCNLHCAHCFVSATKRGSFMPRPRLPTRSSRACVTAAFNASPSLAESPPSTRTS